MKYFTEPLTDENKAILDFVLELRHNSDWKDENILAFLDMMQSRMNIINIKRDMKTTKDLNCSEVKND